MNTASPYTRLAWKEARIVAPVAGVLILFGWFWQLLGALPPELFGAATSTNVFDETSPWLPPLLALLFTLAAAAMLIGNDRHLGIWQWESSLPICWRSSLAIKAAVTLGGMLLIAGLVMLGRQLLSGVGMVPNVVNLSDSAIPPEVIAIVAIQFLPIAFLFALLIREPIWALVAAGVAALALQGLESYVLYRLHVEQWRGLSEWGGAIDLAVSSVRTLILVVLLVAAYRWRRQKGMFADWLPRWDAWQPTAARGWQTAAPALPPPSPLATLSWHAWRANWGTGAFGVVAALYALGSWWFEVQLGAPGATRSPAWLVVAAFALAWTGWAFFPGDQVRMRYRMLSDRGVSPYRTVLVRMAIPVALGLATALAASWYYLLATPPAGGIHDTSERSFGFFLARIALVAPLVGIACGLAFANPIYSLGATLLGLLALQVASLVTLQAAGLYGLFWPELTLLLTLAGIALLAPRWFIEDRPRLGRWVFGSMAAACLVIAVSIPLLRVVVVPHRPIDAAALIQSARLPSMPDLTAAVPLPAPPGEERPSPDFTTVLAVAIEDAEVKRSLAGALDPRRQDQRLRALHPVEPEQGDADEELMGSEMASRRSINVEQAAAGGEAIGAEAMRGDAEPVDWLECQAWLDHFEQRWNQAPSKSIAEFDFDDQLALKRVEDFATAMTLGAIHRGEPEVAQRAAAQSLACRRVLRQMGFPGDHSGAEYVGYSLEVALTRVPDEFYSHMDSVQFLIDLLDEPWTLEDLGWDLRHYVVGHTLQAYSRPHTTEPPQGKLRNLGAWPDREHVESLWFWQRWRAHREIAFDWDRESRWWRRIERYLETPNDAQPWPETDWDQPAIRAMRIGEPMTHVAGTMYAQHAWNNVALRRGALNRLRMLEQAEPSR